MKRQVEIETSIKESIERLNLAVPSEFVVEYWSAKNWKTKKGTPVKSFDIAAHVCNSIYLTRKRKEDAMQPSLL